MRAFVVYLALLMSIAGAAWSQTVDKIRDTNALNIGFRTDASPLSLLDEQGQPAGYSPSICSELAQEIAAALEIAELNVTFTTVDTNDRFERVASGEIDLLCGAATITLSRREIVDFSIPVYVDGTSVLLPRGGARNLQELAGKKLGLRSDTTTQQAVENSYNNAGIEVELVRFTDHNAGVAALVAGEIDAYFADQSILLAFVINDRLGDRFVLLDDVLTVEKQGFALRRGDSEFRLLVDAGLSKLYATGRIQEAFKRAMPGATPGIGLRAMYLIAPTLP